MNISEKVELNGIKRGALAQALSDKNLHRNFHFDYFGKTVRKGTVEVLLSGEWKTIRFDEKDGWARKIEVL